MGTGLGGARGSGCPPKPEGEPGEGWGCPTTFQALFGVILETLGDPGMSRETLGLPQDAPAVRENALVSFWGELGVILGTPLRSQEPGEILGRSWGTPARSWGSWGDPEELRGVLGKLLVTPGRLGRPCGKIFPGKILGMLNEILGTRWEKILETPREILGNPEG